jgi:hypothetical protein
MTEDDDKKHPDGSLDRQDYLRKVREGLLEKLGIPKETKPERTLQMIQLKKELERINSAKTGLN